MLRYAQDIVVESNRRETDGDTYRQNDYAIRASKTTMMTKSQMIVIDRITSLLTRLNVSCVSLSSCSNASSTSSFVAGWDKSAVSIRYRINYIRISGYFIAICLILKSA